MTQAASTAADTPTAGGPCAGLRIVDMSSLVAGPLCGQMLADLGAEVIKIESPGSDGMRRKFPVHEGLGAFFAQMNRGKKSVSIGVKTAEGRALVHGLVAMADIFIENSRPGVMERLGFGYEELKKINDRLIYVSINGFGNTGPYANRPAYDTVIQGLTGFMPFQGSDQDPAVIRSFVADKITAMWASHSTLAAIVHRERTGEGQKVSVNMITAYSAFILPDQMQNHTFQSAGMAKVNLGNAFHRTLDTADGSVIGMILQTAQIDRICTALNCPELIGDPRFADPTSILLNGGVLYDRIADTVAKMTTDQFLALMAEAHIPFGRVNSVEEFIASDEAHHCNVFVDVDDPVLGTIKQINHPAVFERSPANATRRAPLMGEHNEEIAALVGQVPAGARAVAQEAG
jgi:crotonobetainyl-CoA:carnitine CoA-transferase CaiB-like acyl-CoA transferase